MTVEVIEVDPRVPGMDEMASQVQAQADTSGLGVVSVEVDARLPGVRVTVRTDNRELLADSDTCRPYGGPTLLCIHADKGS